MKSIIAFILSILFMLIGIVMGLPREYVALVLFAFSSFLLYQYGERGGVFWASFYGTLFYGVYVFKMVLAPFFLALWLAFLTAPIVDFFEKRRVTRWISSLIIVLILFLFTLGFITMAGVQVIKSAPSFYNNIHDFLLSFFAKLKHFAILGQDAGIIKEKVYPSLNKLFLGISTYLVNISYSAITFAGSLLFLFLTFVIVFYVLVDYDKVTQITYSFLRFGGFREVELDFIGKRLRRYMRGQLLEATIIGILTAFGLGILGIDFYVFLGILAGIMNLIPSLGFWLSYIPALFVGLGSGNWTWGAIKVTLVFVVVQAMETAFISPRVLGGSVGIHPMIILFGLLLFGKLFGAAGVIIAVPTIAIVQGILKFRNKSSSF